MTPKTSGTTRNTGHGAPRGFMETPDYLIRQGILKLLEIKDSDIRILTLEQCRDAIDKGLHAGGAFSATIPLVALFYGGFLNIDVADPTRIGQDMFVLSKGHAVAALASIYAELGYFDASVLKGSRSYHSILNGHPGPVLPGVQIATGPMGQGMPVAQGFALAGRTSPHFDSYTVTGDGELQEGTIWEAVMFAGQKHLDNLCVLVDRNNGQLDIANRLVFPMPRLESVFESFDWRVFSVDATRYDGVFDALTEFRYGPRTGQPTVIICNSSKGYGALSDSLNRHKVSLGDDIINQEISLQVRRREARVAEFASFHGRSRPGDSGAASRDRGSHEASRGDKFCRRIHGEAGGGACCHEARRTARQADSIRPDSLAAHRCEEGIRGLRNHHGSDESVCPRFSRGFHRRRPGFDQRA